MFSSNQVLEVSGDFDQLECALNFAINLFNRKPKDLCFQTTEDGKFCLGWTYDSGNVPSGWQKFQFDHDTDVMSKIISVFFEKQGKADSEYDSFDGCTKGGFLMKAIPDDFSEEWNGIRNPFYGIVSFERYTNFYAK